MAFLKELKRQFILLVVILFYLNGDIFCVSKNDPHRPKCSAYITPGYTEPHGDLFVEKGKRLQIYCHLYDEFVEQYGPNASSKLVFVRNREDLTREEIDVVNSTTVKLDYIPDVGSAVFYQCQIEKKGICNNYVWVGLKPQPIKDFKCIGQNFVNLTCTWRAPDTYVVNNYSVFFVLPAYPTFFHYCSHVQQDDVFVNGYKNMSCFWNTSTAAAYRQGHAQYFFSFNITNIFGNLLMKGIEFDHYANVRSGPPVNLTLISSTTNSFYLRWTIPTTMQWFPPGLHHRVLYWCEYAGKMWQDGGLLTNESTYNRTGATIYYNLTNLKYAHDLCDIRVSIRSAVATSEAMWSDNSSINVRTNSKVPEYPPKTDMGSFEVISLGRDSNKWNVFVYWSHLNEELRNGDNFRYVVSIDGETEIKPIKATNTYVQYTNLSSLRSYYVNIWSQNDIGYSENKSTVYIPPQNELLPQIQGFTKVEYEKGNTYELAWVEPKWSAIIKDYTIFWCSHGRDRPEQCSGQLNWTKVDKNRTNHNQTVPTAQIYQFAISANSEHGSSGMVWAACIVAHSNFSMNRIRKFQVRDMGPSATTIVVEWKLDCSDLITYVEQYIIYYCPTVSPRNNTCREPRKNLTIADSTVQQASITNLTPYTTYTITIGVKTKDQDNLEAASDAVRYTTSEDAPSVPLNFTYGKVTNSSVYLSWAPPEHLNGVLQWYIITVDGLDRPKMDQSITNITLDGLASYRSYLISIRACTNACCGPSTNTTKVRTQMGAPDSLKPYSRTENGTTIKIKWDPPQEPRGKVEFYQVKIMQKSDHTNETKPIIEKVTKLEYVTSRCAHPGKSNTYYFSVRAVNVENATTYFGEWSPELEWLCTPSSNLLVYMVITGGIILTFFMFYAVKRSYMQCKIMRDVEVKLPPGLTPAVIDNKVPWTERKHQPPVDQNAKPDEEFLLGKIMKGGGDSSGCSSAQHSVSSSMGGETNSQNSSTSDSGTEQPRTPQLNDDIRENWPRQRNKVKGYVVMPTAGGGAPLGQCSETSSIEDIVPTFNDAPAYSLTGEISKMVNPGYIPYTLTSDDPNYVVAGTKMLVPDMLGLMEPPKMAEPYAKVTDVAPFKTDVVDWAKLPATTVKAGYVSIGDAPAPLREHKGYVPHRAFEPKTFKED